MVSSSFFWFFSKWGKLPKKKLFHSEIFWKKRHSNDLCIYYFFLLEIQQKFFQNISKSNFSCSSCFWMRFIFFQNFWFFFLIKSQSQKSFWNERKGILKMLFAVFFSNFQRSVTIYLIKMSKFPQWVWIIDNESRKNSKILAESPKMLSTNFTQICLKLQRLKAWKTHKSLFLQFQLFSQLEWHLERICN